MALNDKLVRALQRAFGTVKIAKEGEPMVYRFVPDVVTGKRRLELTEGQHGEEYRVCCPFCNDSRFRLWINHRWNTTEPVVGHYFGVGQVCCFNDGCDMNQYSPLKTRRECHDRLVKMTTPYLARAMQLQPKIVKRREHQEVKLPDKCIPIDTLADGHKAVQYLRSRNFDPYELAIEWQLQYCQDDPNPNVADRIIIPIKWNDQLVGWQARYIGTPPSSNVPKYYTMPGLAKSQVLYNYDRAKTQPFALLTEGVTDVWRIGKQGVAILGSSLSQFQMQHVTVAWSGTGVGLMLDGDLPSRPRERPDKPTEYEKLREMMYRPGVFKWGVLEVLLPFDKDPGDFPTHHDLWEFVIKVAMEKGYNNPIYSE